MRRWRGYLSEARRRLFVYGPELSMGWVDPWVGSRFFGGLGWVHYTILLFCVDMNQQLACKILFYNYQSSGKYYEIFRSIVDICINRCEILVIQS